MTKEKTFFFDGKVIELLPNANFAVLINDEHKIIAYTSGKMRKNKIRILVGDKVKVAITQYDYNKGRITHRY